MFCGLFSFLLVLVLLSGVNLVEGRMKGELTRGLASSPTEINNAFERDLMGKSKKDESDDGSKSKKDDSKASKEDSEDSTSGSGDGGGSEDGSAASLQDAVGDGDSSGASSLTKHFVTCAAAGILFSWTN